MTDLASLVVTLTTESSKWTSGLDAATKQLAAFEKSVNGLVEDLAGQVAAFFTVDALVEWGKGILENADHMEKFSQSVGDSVEDLSRLQFAMTASGVPASNLRQDFKNLNDEISEAAGNASSKAAIAFNILGVSVQGAHGSVKDVSAVLSEVAQKFSGFADGANKTALATEFFKRTGTELIPFLNLGADGIQALKDKSDALGATLSGAAAKGAEEFLTKMTEFKTVVVDGIGNRIATQLLPSLNDLTKSFEDTTAGASSLDQLADVGANGLRILADAGLTVAKTFSDVGNFLGALGAQAVALFTGHFSQIVSIQNDLDQQIEDSDKKFQDRLAAIWRTGGDQLVGAVKETSDKLKQEAPNLSLAEAAQKAQESLKKIADGISAQVATFGLGEEALLHYRLTLGDLSKDVAAAGANGQKLVKTIEDQAAALDKLKAQKVVDTGLADLNAQIEKLTGNTAGSAIDELDKKYTKFLTDARQIGDTEAIAAYNRVVLLTAATEDFNTETKKSQQLQDGLAETEQLLANLQSKGLITDLQAQKQTSAAYAQQADDLQKVYDIKVKIANQTGNADELAEVAKLGVQIDTLRTQSTAAGDSLRKMFEDDVASSLSDAVTGAKSLGDAFKGLVSGIEKQLADLASKDIVQALFGSAGGGSSGGGFFALLAGIFGGAKADGGPVSGGTPYLVGEQGPEMFVPNTSGSIVPNGGMGGQTVVQHFAIQAPNGTVSRQTQAQVAAAAARGLDQARRRNT